MQQFDVLQAAETVQQIVQCHTEIPVVVVDRTKDAIAEFAYAEAYYPDPIVTELVQIPRGPFTTTELQELADQYQRGELPQLETFLEENGMTLSDWLHDLSLQTGDVFAEGIRQAQAGEWISLDGPDTGATSNPAST